MALEVVVLHLLALGKQLTEVVHDALVVPIALWWIQLYLLLHLLLLFVNLHVQELLDEYLLVLVTVLVQALQYLFLLLLHLLDGYLLRHVKVSIVACWVVRLIF